MSLPTTPNLTPEFVRPNEAQQIFGISKSEIYGLMAAGKIRSHLIRKRGNKSGTRLISTDSLREFIMSHSSGFEQKGGE